MIVRLVPVAQSFQNKTKRSTWKNYGDNRDDPGDRDDHDRLDRFKFYPDDQDDREQLQVIQWKQFSDDGDDRSDLNASQNTPVIPRFNSLFPFHNDGNRHK